MEHGLPEELSRLYALSRMKRNINKLIEESVNNALSAGYSSDRVTEILLTTDYPPPGADEQWLKGWFAAKAGDPVPNDPASYLGYQAWLKREG